MKTFDIVVIGGGLIGMTAAHALSKRHFSVALIDKNALTPEFKKNTRAYAINADSSALLQQLGVLTPLNASIQSPFRNMQVFEACSSARIDFDSSMIGEAKLGDIIEEHHLKEVLYHTICHSDFLTLMPDTTLLAITDHTDHIELKTSSGAISSKLLIIADGVHSPSRKMLAIAETSWSYHQHAIVATVSHAAHHQQTAYQIFHKQGPLAFLPLSNPHQSSIVWTTTAKEADTLCQMDIEPFNQALTEAFEGKLGATKLMSDRTRFPLMMRHTKRYTGNHWLIMGDAAHTIHPLAGLGLNIDFGDIATLLSLLDEGKRPWSHQVLGPYHRQRTAMVWQMITLVGMLKNLFRETHTPLTFLRRLGLQALNQSVHFKSFFIRQAAKNL